MHNDKKKQYTAKDLATKLNQIIEEADKYNDILSAQPAPFTPKSYAKDFYSFSQGEIMSLISKDNGYTSLLNYKFLVSKLYPLQNEELIFHTISKVILKKKKDLVKSYNDLRGIAIMPALIMVLEKKNGENE